MTWPRPISCEHSRYLAALAPDGVLSELETRSLDRHLRRCGQCKEFAHSVLATTAQLRAAELEPLPVGFRATLDVPSRSRRSMWLSLAGLTGAVAGMLVASVLALDGSTPPARQASPPVLSVGAAPEDEAAVLRQFRNAWLARRAQELEQPKGQPGMFLD